MSIEYVTDTVWNSNCTCGHPMHEGLCPFNCTCKEAVVRGEVATAVHAVCTECGAEKKHEPWCSEYEE